MSHHGPVRNTAFGVVAEYDSPEAIVAAANSALDAGYSSLDAFTPMPVHGLDDAIGFNETLVPWIVAGGGVTGCLGGLLLQWWVSVHAYPLNIGGRPLFSWPQFIPPMFETTILLSAFGAVFGMLILNRLPQPYHPVFSAPNFDRATQDRFFLLVEAKDPAYKEEDVIKLLDSTKALNVTAIKQEEVQDW